MALQRSIRDSAASVDRRGWFNTPKLKAGEAPGRGGINIPLQWPFLFLKIRRKIPRIITTRENGTRKHRTTDATVAG